jgi:hypothetical protein
LPQPWSPLIVPQSKKAKAKDANQGFTSGDPMKYIDDDLFGYMIAGAEDKDSTDADDEEIEVPDEDTGVNPRSGRKAESQKRDTTRRTAPIRMHAPIAFSGIRYAKDFQTLSRHVAYTGGNAVLNPNPPSFYTGWLKTRIIIEANRVGKFYIGKNQDILLEQANGLEVQYEADPYSKDQTTVPFIQLAPEIRLERVQLALKALADIGNNAGPSSGALHDGSLRPKAFIGAFMKCADSPFDAVWEGTSERPRFSLSSLTSCLRDYDDLFASRTIYIGLPTDESPEREDEIRNVINGLSDVSSPFSVEIGTVRRTLQKFAASVVM